MKYIKKFEANKENDDNEVEVLRDVLMENPSYNTHDFYMFIGRPEFKEEEDGRYRKTLEIERMMKITPDQESIGTMKGLTMRARFDPSSTVYHIWLPKDIEEEVSYKGSNDIEPWLVDLINQHKMRGSDEHGRQVYNDVLQRRQNADKYNL